MAKLKLVAAPTFVGKVGIPVPGADKRHTVRFTFKHMTKAEFDRFNVGSDEPEIDTLMRYVEGWSAEDVDEEFSRDGLERMCNAYPGSAYAISVAYAAELHGNRLGN